MYRVGPGIIQVGDNCYKHPFDMLSVIHKYKLSSEKNKCSYQNKIVDSEASKTFCWVHLLTPYIATFQLEICIQLLYLL